MKHNKVLKYISQRNTRIQVPCAMCADKVRGAAGEQARA